MASDHIVKSFDEELTALHQAIVTMGELSRSQFDRALGSFARHDTALAAQVIKHDAEVDALERELDARAVRVLALRQPMARDLRQVLSALRIGTEFERIADFAANIAKRALALGSSAPQELVQEIQSLGAAATKLLAQVIAAYRERDAEQALAVWAFDEHIDESYTLAYHRIVFWMQADATRVPAGAHLLFIAKNIERIGDHATNIAESIHFQVKGEWLSLPRPKGDTTSSEPIADPPGSP